MPWKATGNGASTPVMDGYLSKPFDANDLFASIEE